MEILSLMWMSLMGENHCAYAMVAKDSGGRLIYVRSQRNSALEAQQAELEALI